METIISNRRKGGISNCGFRGWEKTVLETIGLNKNITNIDINFNLGKNKKTFHSEYICEPNYSVDDNNQDFNSFDSLSETFQDGMNLKKS